MITGGEDQTLCFWNLLERKQKKAIKLDGQAMTVAMNPTGEHIAVGFKSGHFKVFKYSNMALVVKNADRKKAIS